MILPQLQPSLVEAVLGVETPVVYPPCPDCGGESGSRTSSRGVQEYQCKNTECNRAFRDSTKNQPRKKLSSPRCPDCRSDRVHRRGLDHKTGQTKYTCYECLRSFRGSTQSVTSQRFLQAREENPKSTNDQAESELELLGNYPPCPDCNSRSKLRGIVSGERNLQCMNQSCNRRFRDSTKDRKRDEACRRPTLGIPPCPDCKSNWIRKKGICKSTGSQKYYCNDCKRVFTDLTKGQPRPIYPPCLNCGSSEVKKHGKRNGAQLYRCKACKSFFSDAENPPCPDCNGQKIKRAGLKRGQQKYQCKDCGRHFSESTRDKPRNSPSIFDYDSDHWDLRAMGISFPPSANWFTANFGAFKHYWLKQAVKEYFRFQLNGKSPNTCLSKLNNIKKFASFLKQYYQDITPQEVTRQVILDFRVYLNQFSKELARETLLTVREFISLADRFKWLDIPSTNLVFEEDLPRLQKSGKTFDQIIPDEVLEQFVKNLDGLWWQHARMAVVMMAAPLRISEVCGMRFDCIRQDSEKDWWLHFWDYKLNKEHNPIPIIKEIAEMIQLQQQFIRNTFGDGYEFLFCSRSGGRRKDGTFKYEARPPYADTFRQSLRQLVQDRRITYNDEPYSISKTHRFRHTGASELINRGMPLVMVQEILGHESPEMTLVYAKLYDNTLKEAWKEASPTIVDITGAVVKLERTKLDSPKYKEMKKRILEQKVHNGSCALPAIQTCPKFHACYTCSHFRATLEDLPNLKADKSQMSREIEEFENEARKYRNTGQLRMAEGCMSRAKQASEKVTHLEKMIAALEANCGVEEA